MNKKIILSTMSILSALALLSGATFAFFSDQAKSTGNTFSTGNADLQITNDLPPGNPGLYSDSVSGATFSDIAPGFSEDKDFWLKNNSTGDFSMNATADLANLGGTNNGILPDNLMVMFRCDTNNNGLGDGGDTLTSNKTVNAWLSGAPETLGTIGPNDGASNATTASDQDELFCRMTASLSGDADNDVAGTDLSFDGVFDGTQIPPGP